MTDRAQKLMTEIWDERNSWADTEEKLVAAVIRKTLDHCKTFVAQKMGNMSVVDKTDLIQLSNELESLS
jgi:hypothetical protein